MGNLQTKNYRKQLLQDMEGGVVVVCALCDEPIPRKVSKLNRLKHGGKGGLSIDHKLPLSLGGNSNRTNLQPTHLKCNSDKANNYPTKDSKEQ